MDMTEVNRERQMMERQGMDPAMANEAIRMRMESKARFGLAAVVAMMVGLGVIALTTSQHGTAQQAAFGPESPMAHPGMLIARDGDAGLSADRPILWFAGADRSAVTATR